MFLKAVIIQNYRGYKNRHRIEIGELTAFIGKNDVGKSTIFDALAIFFEHPLGKIDSSDICVHTDGTGELRIGCIFQRFPDTITIDATSETTLAGEHLLNEDGDLEIHKVFQFVDCNLKLKPQIFAIAYHPTSDDAEGLLSKKNADLKKIADKIGVDDSVDRRSNVALRSAIWEKSSELQRQTIELQLDKEDAKSIWTQISGYLPEFA